MFFKRSCIALAIICSQIHASVVEINDINQFNNKIKTGKSVVKFYMDNCPPCKASAPMFTTLSQSDKYQDVNFITVNFNRGKRIVLKYARMFPTFAIFKDGAKVGGNIVGYDNKTQGQIISRIDAL